MSFTLRPAFYVPAAVLLVFTTVVVTLAWCSHGAALTQPTVPAWLSAGAVTAILGIFAYGLNREVAFRSATIEAQKMLLEINKQYVATPELLRLEGEYEGDVDEKDPKFTAQLKAMAYLKLNVFEVIFAVLPYGAGRDTWVKYFRSSLKQSSVMADELGKYNDIYHPSLIEAYEAWKRDPR